jgi:hypothetical protein
MGLVTRLHEDLELRSAKDLQKGPYIYLVTRLREIYEDIYVKDPPLRS